MNNDIRGGAAVSLAIGIAMFATAAQANHEVYTSASNAPAHCQAFTPGPTNTVRNRVTGAENTGPAMNVACAFESIGSDAAVQPVTDAGVQIANNGSSAFSVSCSELSGYFGDAGTVIAKTTGSVAPGASEQVDFSAEDTPDEEDGDLGYYTVGIVCNLPTHAVIGGTHATWYDEDGVGG
jgi:hypothetical protein